MWVEALFCGKIASWWKGGWLLVPRAMDGRKAWAEDHGQVGIDVKGFRCLEGQSG